MNKRFTYIILAINAVLIIVLIGSFLHFRNLVGDTQKPEKRDDFSDQVNFGEYPDLGEELPEEEMTEFMEEHYDPDDWVEEDDSPVIVGMSLAERVKSEVNDDYNVRRFFLSRIDKDYIPAVHWCLFENKDRMLPIYPSYVYENWGVLPEDSQDPEVSIVTYFLLPEDNANFHPDSSCYIKEIKTDQDWQEIERSYNF